MTTTYLADPLYLFSMVPVVSDGGTRMKPVAAVVVIVDELTEEV